MTLRASPDKTAPLGARIGRSMLRPVDSSWLAFFRILFGLLLAISMERFIAYGWIERFFVEPSFHFKYWGFEWVEPLSASGMRVLFLVLGVLAALISAGFLFRLAAPAFAVGFTYIQLIDVTTYLNHYYLAALLCFLLAISPANQRYSVDAWLARRFFGRPPAETIPAAWLYLFRTQVGLVYFFAGMAKAQSDWLLHAQPLRIWLGANTDLPLLGPLFTLDWVPLAMSWFGFLFDTTIVGWLLFAKTRRYAYAVCIVFHTLTRLLFPIGMFPLIMVLSASLFFDPSWPRRALARARRFFSRTASALELAPSTPRPSKRPSALGLAALGVGALYCALQLALPLRHWAYGGNVLWHEQGMRFSWRVMVRAKGGSITFIVRDKQSGKTYHVSPRAYLTALQESEMSSQPDLILQLAHHIRADFERRGVGPVEVHADARVSLNGRRGAPLVDPSVDLGRVSDGLGRATWVLPAPRQAPPHTKPVL